MAKREDKRKNDSDRLRRRVIMNWVICGASFIAIIILRLIAQNK